MMAKALRPRACLNRPFLGSCAKHGGSLFSWNLTLFTDVIAFTLTWQRTWEALFRRLIAFAAQKGGLKQCQALTQIEVNHPALACVAIPIRSHIPMNNTFDLTKKFRARFSGEALVYRAPGRVNLIGEHTDYNDGLVLPAAIGFSCWIAIAPRTDRKISLYSENFDESIEADLDNAKIHSTGKWPDYPLGVAWALEKAGCHLTGANIYIRGEVPLGAGLSSSAALEVSTGYALLDLANHPIELTKLALLCQQAENEFVGARVGIMDQFVSCHGQAGSALLLDCRSLDFRLLPLPRGVQLVICNTMVQHKLGTSEYNVRRTECEEGVRLLSKGLPGIRALRDVSLPDLELHRGLLSETVYKRCRHVITENFRTGEAAAALQSEKTEALRNLMAESHSSLRDDYEVSCRELDLMVDLAMQQEGVLGARMTGGGFGGCTINLVNAADSEKFRERVSKGYEVATGYHPNIYVCEASQGAEKVAGHALKITTLTD
jgi:galactokinase